MAQSGRSADCVARFGSGRKADMPNQRVKCPLMTLSGHGEGPWRAQLSLRRLRRSDLRRETGLAMPKKIVTP